MWPSSINLTFFQIDFAIYSVGFGSTFRLNKVPKADFDGNDRSSVPFAFFEVEFLWLVTYGENLRPGETTNPHYVRGLFI